LYRGYTGVTFFWSSNSNTKALQKLEFGSDLTKANFTFQLSDHLPLWMQMNTDIDGVQLDQIIRARSMRKPR
jgi:hypothetical protein